jgi:D-alanyl-D-alanine dipeptidase
MKIHSWLIGVSILITSQLLFTACTSMTSQSEPTNATQEIFRVTPVRPIAELLPLALAAQPPLEKGPFLPSDLVEIITLDPTIKLDIRYATSDNLISTPVYQQPRAFLQRSAVQSLVRVQQALAKDGYGLLVYDAYRPWYVTKLFWDALPENLHNFVADPAQGSRHNRGCAVDLTLVDLKTGQPVAMPSLYDETTERAYPNYTGGTVEQRRNRDLLRRSMEAEGFTVYPYEWWHFDCRDWHKYAIQNLRFGDIR